MNSGNILNEVGKLDSEWKIISDSMRSKIGEAAYQSWIKPISVRDLDGGTLQISLPTRFMRDWVIAHYLEKLEEEWTQVNPQVKKINIIIQSERSDEPESEEMEDVESVNLVSEIETQSETFGNLSASLDKRFKFDQFVVGTPNEFAYAAR